MGAHGVSCPMCFGAQSVRVDRVSIMRRVCSRCNGIGRVDFGQALQLYVGETQDRRYLEELKRHKWGRIWTVSRPRTYQGEPWAFDNGAYSDFLKGQPFDEVRFQKRLDKATNDLSLMPPQMAVLPDVVAGGMKSARYSLDWLTRLEDHPWKNWYFAIQDRQTAQEVGCALSGFPVSAALSGTVAPGPIHPKVTGIFLGGSDKFKLTVSYWAGWAHDNGLKFHYGRASTPGRIRAARRSGCDSMDTSFPLWTRERFEKFILMWTLKDPQQELELQ